MGEVQPDPAAAMQAVTGHLERGDVSAAEAAMTPLTDADLHALDVAAIWVQFRAAGFTYGQARLASSLEHHPSRNIGLRLWRVEWLIEQGQSDAALAGLHDLLQMDGASLHIVQALYCYARLGQLDLASEAVELVAKAPHGSAPDQIRIGFEVAAFLQAHGMRGVLSRHLHRLGGSCEGDLGLTIQLADCYLAIDERSFALDALERLPEPAASAPMSKLYRVQLSAERHRPARLAMLQPLRTETTTDWEFWLKLSYVAESLDDLPLALHAARTALDNGPADPVWLRIRLVRVLSACGQHKPAIAEIEALLANDVAMKFSAQVLGDAAIAGARPDLAVSVCARWLETSPEDIQAMVMNCVYRRTVGGAGERHAAAALALQGVRSGQPVTRQQFRLLVDSIGGVNSAWETELAEAATRRYPDDEEFAALAKPDSFAARFRLPEPAPATVSAPKRAGGWLSRLGFRA